MSKFNREIFKDLYKEKKFREILLITDYIVKFDKNIIRIYEQDYVKFILQVSYFNTRNEKKCGKCISSFVIKKCEFSGYDNFSIRQKLTETGLKSIIKKEL